MRIPYLWVDALCILQDDAEEKVKLIGIMDQIYGAAVVTLVAAEGTNSNAGLPGVRIAEKARTNYKYSDKRIGPWVLSMAAEDLLSIQRQALWTKRGWTFQEKIMSKRLLIFGKTQCYFWCNSGLLQEDIHLETDPRRHEIDICMFKKATDKHLGRTCSPLNSYPLRNYDEAVSAYISRRLTYAQDALSAFRGIANMLEATLGNMFWYMPERAWSMCMSWHWVDARVAPEHFPDAFVARPSDAADGEEDDNPNKGAVAAGSAPLFPSWSWLSSMSRCPFKVGAFVPLRGEHHPRFVYHKVDAIDGSPCKIVSDVTSAEEYLRDAYSLDDEPAGAGASDWLRDYTDHDGAVPSVHIAAGETTIEDPSRPDGYWSHTDPDRLVIYRREPCPLDHLLVFWAPSYYLHVDAEPVEKYTLDSALAPERSQQVSPESLVPGYRTYLVRASSELQLLGQVILPQKWRGDIKDAQQFIMIATDTTRADLMLIEWDAGLAKRVQVIRGVKLCDLDQVSSSLEMIVLA
ncbi:hypothetical protein PG994_013293 [Apiospora phragmitis]|uniref:Heterokaryon incompatibility domain-containing protein n=1 Tax=Apiospora phragmitis TaxID=2905665 RepID=A0ABR1T884_9PEZI